MVKKQIPQFWYASEEETSPLAAMLLKPISLLYQGISTVNRTITRTRKSPLPVICIGNLTMGGAGKTPTARAIHDLVKSHGKFATPCFLMRGYGGKNKGPVEVDLTSHTSWDVGDEALMQARYAPTIVSRNRYDGARLAKQLGYDLIIMDDGFQNMSLKKDISLIVIDGGFGLGNAQCFPSGPLRETVESGTNRASAALVINRTDTTKNIKLGALKQFDATIALQDTGQQNDKKEVIAFAGIARPEKFFNTLEENGYHLHAHYGFPDHVTYTHGQLQKLMSYANKEGIPLITTEKDWVRLSKKWQSKISYLKIAIHLDDNFKKYITTQLDKMS
jgi:tetraacyldisaccharide 4'-kinase